MATFYAAAGALLTHLGLEAEPLLKGVDPHASHYQDRGPGGKFTPAGNGPYFQTLPDAERAAAKERAAELIEHYLTPRLLEHLERQQAGEIDGAEWEKRCLQDLRYYYREVYVQGKRYAGNPL